MKIKLKNKTKRAICIYIIVLLLLYIVVEILPRVTDIFETTQILEPGNLTLSYETTGYFIKEECVGIAGESGSIKYLVDEKTAVKKRTSRGVGGGIVGTEHEAGAAIR